LQRVAGSFAYFYAACTKILMSKSCCRQLQPITAHDENVAEVRHTFELKLLPAYRTHFLPDVIMAVTKFKSGCHIVYRDTNFV